MSAPRDKQGCGCCGGIFSLGLSAVFLWLWIHTSNPRCSIQTLSLPSLSGASNLTSDPTLSLTLRLVNPNQLKGIKYDPLNVTVYDFPNRSNVIGNISMPGFYQGYMKKASKLGRGTANMSVVLPATSENGTGVFRVQMATAVKFRTIYGYSKRHRIRVGADVVVNASGVKVDPKGIRLRSMAPKMTGSSFAVLVALVNYLFFPLLCFW
ncbi:Multidrug/pheromone exporter, MDR family, ABC transporter family [Hibiscus syriacus]|uniref:Multidrug/pheromone exporter, MDR family, ABC transporter family n=1 Tax=Hibiscus syriacus TaxID=106335 RepID=A0A6A3AUI8_HIBSY|nr:protein NDR1-like [Hibiscus syriacus]KAE8706542.1 Multidrug/pheromone exporter, MDR family, ABC transporter family [Hibiscus syriacus]